MLLRHVSGLGSPEESVRVCQWASESPANAAELVDLQRAWELMGETSTSGGDTKVVWNRVAAVIRSERAPSARRDENDTSRADEPARSLSAARQPHVFFADVDSPRRGALGRGALGARLAAAVVLIAVAGGVAWRLASLDVPRPNPGGSTHDVATSASERAELRLADGSRIVLGPATLLRVPRTFGEGSSERAVWLDGEGYFEIAHDAAHPFVVRTRSSVVRDIGTAFDVRAYGGDAAVQVVVAEGEVTLAGGAQPADSAKQSSSSSEPTIALRAGDLGMLDAAGVPRLRHDVNPSHYIDWTRGVLHFDDVALADAVTQLDRQYDLDIEVRVPALLRRHFTASFTEQNVDEMLRGLAFLLDARYERAGRRVRLSARGHGR